MTWPTDYINQVICGDCLDVIKTMPDNSVNCCITSPPYWGLRDYGVSGQLGLEKTPEEYVAHMVDVFREVRRVLINDGTLWLNLGDSYAGSGKGGNPEGSEWAGFVGNKNREKSAQVGKPIIPNGLKPKDLVGIPWRVAFALQADGWYLRQDIIWAKPNPMPESVTDRCTKAHEYIFLLSKSARYYYDGESIREEIKPTTNGIASVRPSGDTKTRDREHWGIPHEGRGNITRVYAEIKGANRRSVWTVTTKPFREAHFATFPPDLIEPCALAGCPENGVILDPFMGSGTTGIVAKQLYRNFIGVELNPQYIEMANGRINQTLVNKKLEFK